MPYYPQYQNRSYSYRRAPAKSHYSLAGRGAYSYRPRRTIRGKGAYSYDNPGPYGKAGETFGAMVGGKYGGPIGSYALSRAGRYLGHKVGRLFGSGAYGVTDGSTHVMAPDPPKFGNDKSDDSVTITHREYLGDLLTSSTAGGLKIEEFPLNPASTQTFPWLANIVGPNYQQYKFEGLVFEFKSFSADALNSSNTALGSVFACINYDSTDQDFTTRGEIENSDWSRSCKPSEDVMIPVECAPRQTSMRGLLYVLNQNVIPYGSDPKTYLLGKLSIGTTGFQAPNINIGSLYVTYKIKLYKPYMSKPASFSNFSQFIRGGTSNTAVLGTGTSVNSPIYCDTLGVTFVNSSKFTINKNRLLVGQVYILRMVWQGLSSASVQPPDVNALVTSGIEGMGNYVSTVSAHVSFPGAPVTDDRCGFDFAFIVRDDSKDVEVEFPTTGNALPGSSILTMNLWQVNGIAPQNIGVYNGGA